MFVPDFDALNKKVMGLETWKPDVVVGVDFGMTGTGVAYSSGPEWARPETIQHWPDATGTGLADKVSTIISYDVETDQVATWGFTVDLDNPRFRIEENFKLYLDPGYRDEFHHAPSLAEARRWFTDFLSCVYKSITQHFRETIPRWWMRRVEFVFSVPTTWKDPAMIAETEQLIRNAGFGRENGHTVEISLTEAEAAAVYASKQQYEKGDVFLVCDAGGGTTDVNILKTADSNVGQIELEPLSCVEGQPIGSTLINFKVEKLITERLESIRNHLPAEPKKIAEKMMRDRFETFKCCFGTEAMNVTKLPLYVTGLPRGLDFPQAHIEDSRMIITTGELQSIFDEQIERIFQLIDGELKNLWNTHAGENVSYLVLSGGLGSSPYVQRRIRRRYEEGAGNYPNARNIVVLKAPKPQLAVVHGLVMDRVQRIKEDKVVYKERCCRNSYGILVRQLYDPQLHWREDVEKDPRDRKQWAINQIDWFIKKGETVSIEDGIKHHYNLKLDPAKIDSPWKTRMVMSTLPVAELPRSLKKEGAKSVCAVESVLSHRDMKKKNRHWYNRGPEYYRAEFDMKVIIGAADLKFEMLGKDGVVSRPHGEVQVQWATGTKETKSQQAVEETFGELYKAK